MSFNSIAYYALSFLAVVKAHSFSAAAKKLGMSKAQVSRHISALEDMLGTQLLIRSTRSITLTEEGKQFYASCESIEAICADAVNSLKTNNKNMQGTLRITAPIDFGIQFITPIVREYSQQYPKMNVSLSFSNFNEDIVEQNFDLSIRIANQLPNLSYRMRELMKFKRIYCASPDYIAKFKKPKLPDEIRYHQCITSVNRNANLLYPQWSFLVNKKSVNYKLEQFIEVDSLFSQKDLILAGLGIGRLPDYLIQKELEQKKLVEIFSQIEKPDTYVYLLYPNISSLPVKTRVFVDMLISRFIK